MADERTINFCRQIVVLSIISISADDDRTDLSDADIGALWGLSWALGPPRHPQRRLYLAAPETSQAFV